MSGTTASVQNVPPNDPGLAAFREKDAAARGFSDQTDPLAPAAIESRAAPAAAPEPDEPDMPRLRIDPRNAISARVKASRAARNADGDTAPADKFNIPAGVRVEGEDADEAARRAEEADAARAQPRQQPASAPSADGRYTLKVNGNSFGVSRDELLRYAEVDADEAKDYSDMALVRLAQKQIAASTLLDAAKAEAKGARTAQRASQVTMPDSEPEAEAGSPGAPQGLHSLSDRDLMEKVQFGDPDEALEAQQLLTRRQYDRISVNDRIATIDREIGDAITSFGESNADIASDNFYQSAHRAALVDMTVDEIAAHARGMTPSQVAQLKANPNLAMQAYKAARLDGLQLRTPAELFDAAANTVRTRFGGQPPVQDRGAPRDISPPAGSDRTEAKRGLLAQPRPESASSFGGQQQPARRPSASERVRAAYGNRMNRG